MYLLKKNKMLQKIKIKSGVGIAIKSKKQVATQLKTASCHPTANIDYC